MCNIWRLSTSCYTHIIILYYNISPNNGLTKKKKKKKGAKIITNPYLSWIKKINLFILNIILNIK
jgi:hypothetical protein